MKKKLFAGIVALAVGAFTSASAADLPVAYKAAPPPAHSVFTRTGCYVGANGGAGRADNYWEPILGQDLGPVRGNGWIAGVQGGCDYQQGPLVVGVEGQFDWADMKGESLFNALGPAGTTLSSKLD